MPQLDFLTWLMVFARLSGLLAVFPLFSMANVPVRVRIGLGALMAFLLSPAVVPVKSPPASLMGWIGLMAAEIGVGLLLGYVCRLLFYILEFAGSVVATETGLNLAAAFSSLSSARSDAPGLMLFNLGMVLFMACDLHHWLLVALHRIYQWVPIGGVRLQEPLLTELVERVGQVFLVGLLMAAPVLAVVFLINLLFAVLGRAVPQMNVFAESLSFRIVGGMAVFGLSLHLVAQHVLNYLRRLPEDLMRVAQLLGGS